MEDDLGYVYCKCFIPPVSVPREKTPMQLMRILNDYFVRANLKTQCYFASFRAGETNQEISLNTTEDVRLIVNQLKKSMDLSFFDVPKEFRSPQHLIEFNPQNAAEDEGNSDQLSDKFLNNFIINKNDSVDQKEQKIRFQEYQMFCQEVLALHKNKDLISKESQHNFDSQRQDNMNEQNQNKDKQSKNNVFMCYGPKEELEFLDNKQIYFDNKTTNKLTFFYFRTLDKNKNLIIDKSREKKAIEDFSQSLMNIQLNEIQFGILEPFNNDQDLYFYDFITFSTKKSSKTRETPSSLVDLSISFSQNDQIDKNQLSIDFLLTFTEFELRVTFPIVFLDGLIKDKENNQFFFQLIVPPRFYIKKEQKQDQQVHLNPKKYEWERIDNFIALDIGETVSELLRIEYVNNTVIRFELPPNSDIFLKIIEKTFSKYFFKKSMILNKSAMRLDFSQTWINLQSLDFDLAYSILTLLSHNKTSVFTMDKFIKWIKQKQQDGYSDFVLKKAIEDLYHSRGYVSSSDKTMMFQLKRFQITAQFSKMLDSVKSKESLLLIVQKSMDRNTNSIASRRISVTPSGLIYNLKELEQANRVMRIFRSNSDSFLRAVFSDDSLETPKQMAYLSEYFRKVLEQVTILNKTYNNFGWSASQLRACSCWYFSNSEFLTKADVISRIGNFEGINPPAKKSARIGQCFSSSTPFYFKTRPNIKVIEDIKTPEFEEIIDEETGLPLKIYKKQKVFTDGIGMISKDLLIQIKDKLEAPFMCAIQVRFGGAKGVFTLKEELEPNTIYVRDSMLKYSITDSSDELQIDILDRNKYREGYLNRQVIILLRTLGIPNEFFIRAQEEYIDELSSSALKDANIFSLFNNDYAKEGTNLYPITRLLRLMNAAKVNISEDSFCQGVIYTLKKRGFYILRKKSNIYLKQSARLMGVIDEYKLLKENEVFLFISADGNRTFKDISGEAIVVKNPCLHPGDIRKVTAVSLAEIQSRIPNNGYNPFNRLRNVLIFPQVGKQPITSQIAGSDLDGDCYFISWDKRFIPKAESEPFNYDEDSANPQKLQLVPLEKDKKIPFLAKAQKSDMTVNQQMLDFFIEFMNNENLGRIDNTHLAIADQSKNFANHKSCLELASLHALAVDYAKTGKSPQVPKNLVVSKFPDFMEKPEDKTYQSDSILGILYRQVKDQYEQYCKQKKENDQKATQIDETLLFNPVYLEDDDEEDNAIDTRNSLLQYLKEELDKAIEVNEQWNKEINNIKSFFGASDEFEIYTGNFSKLIKVERKKKMSADVVQQRVVNLLLDLKRKFELEFFASLPADKETFHQKTAKEKYYSKRCKLRATTWFILSYLRNESTLDSLNFEKTTFCGQLVKEIRSRIPPKESEQRGNGNENSSQKIFQENIGLAWFIIGEIILEIKRTNNNKPKQKEDQKKSQFNLFSRNENGDDDDDASTSEPDDEI